MIAHENAACRYSESREKSQQRYATARIAESHSRHRGRKNTALYHAGTWPQGSVTGRARDRTRSRSRRCGSLPSRNVARRIATTAVLWAQHHAAITCLTPASQGQRSVEPSWSAKPIRQTASRGGDGNQRDCMYRNDRGTPSCDHLLLTGEQRGCPVEGCTKYKKGKAPKRYTLPTYMGKVVL